MTNAYHLEGTRIPEVTFRTRQHDQWIDITSNELFNNKKVIVFALPGAFTPTCSSTHLPRYNELAQVFFENDISDIICISVNDSFVMNAWKEDQNAEHITFIPDGNGEFSDKLGMLVDKEDLGFGKRSWRYSMLVNNGLVEKMFVEPNKSGDPFEVSDADTMLSYLNPKAKKPKRIAIISKPGCSHCSRARAMLKNNNYQYEEIKLGEAGVSFSFMSAISGRGTTPQIFIDGTHIGGADELEQYLKSDASA